MKTVRQFLQGKGNAIWSVAPETSVYDALELMASKDVGALMVLEGGRLVGIITERDYARKLVLAGKASRDTNVGDVMTGRVIYVQPDQGIEECMALMSDKH